MGKSTRVANAAAKIRSVRSEEHETTMVAPARTSMLPPLPSEMVAAEAERTGVVLTDEEQLAALEAAAEAEPRIPEVVLPAPAAEVVATRTARYSTADRIVDIVVNPKRPGTAGSDRYAVYRHGMLVSAYIADRRVGKFARADLSWDLSRGFIRIVPEAEFVAMTAASSQDSAAEGKSALPPVQDGGATDQG